MPQVAKPRTMERLKTFVDVAEDGCWNWTGNVSDGGYGYFPSGSTLDGSYRNERAHRVSYELAVAPIPAELTIDHLCNNRRCVNPEHLATVSIRENVLRSETGPSAVNARKDKCVHGHDLDGIRRRSDGTFRQRYCRTCARAATRAFRQRATA